MQASRFYKRPEIAWKISYLAFVNISIEKIFVFKVWHLQWEAARSLSKQHVALSGILMAFRSLVGRIDRRIIYSDYSKLSKKIMVFVLLLSVFLSSIPAFHLLLPCVGYTAMCDVV